MKHFLFVFGTRPEAIKLFPLYKTLRSLGAGVTLLCTAQHTDLISDVLSSFSICADITLAALPRERTTAQLIGHILKYLPHYLDALSPDAVIVQGDTASAFAGALCAFLHSVPVVHVEAGLRTYNISAPFPEDSFRRAIGTMASLHFAPSEHARCHLVNEGVDAHRIYTVGNTVVDAMAQLCPARTLSSPPYAILTTHRRESEGEGRSSIFRAVRRLAEKYPSFLFLYPLHKGKKTRTLAEQMLAGQKNLHLCEPMPPDAFYRAMAGASFLLTDSGGISEEGAALGVPTFVLRESTEREHELSCGALVLVGTDENKIFDTVSEYIEKGTPTFHRVDVPNTSPSLEIARILLRAF